MDQMRLNDMVEPRTESYLELIERLDSEGNDLQRYFEQPDEFISFEGALKNVIDGLSCIGVAVPDLPTFSRADWCLQFINSLDEHFYNDSCRVQKFTNLLDDSGRLIQIYEEKQEKLKLQSGLLQKISVEDIELTKKINSLGVENSLVRKAREDFLQWNCTLGHISGQISNMKIEEKVCLTRSILPVLPESVQKLLEMYDSAAVLWVEILSHLLEAVQVHADTAKARLLALDLIADIQQLLAEGLKEVKERQRSAGYLKNIPEQASDLALLLEQTASLVESIRTPLGLFDKLIEWVGECGRRRQEYDQLVVLMQRVDSCYKLIPSLEESGRKIEELVLQVSQHGDVWCQSLCSATISHLKEAENAHQGVLQRKYEIEEVRATIIEELKALQAEVCCNYENIAKNANELEDCGISLALPEKAIDCEEIGHLQKVIEVVALWIENVARFSNCKDIAELATRHKYIIDSLETVLNSQSVAVSGDQESLEADLSDKVAHPQESAAEAKVLLIEYKDSPQLDECLSQEEDVTVTLADVVEEIEVQVMRNDDPDTDDSDHLGPKSSELTIASDGNALSDTQYANMLKLISWDKIPQESVLELTPIDLFELTPCHQSHLVILLESLPVEMVVGKLTEKQQLLESLDLLSVSSNTLSWLMAHCGGAFLFSLIAELSRIVREITHKEAHFKNDLYSETPFVSEDLLFYLLENQPIFSNGLMITVLKECLHDELMTSISEATIFDRRRFTPESIMDVALFYTLAREHEDGVAEIRKKLHQHPNCCSFSDYMMSLLEDYLSASESSIIIKYEGWLSQPVKVSELAHSLHCTTQNVYRLIHSAEAKLSTPKVIDQLKGLALLVFSEIYRADGIIAHNDLCIALKERHGWSDQPSKQGIDSILKRSNVKGIILNNDWFVLVNRMCLAQSAKANIKWTYFDQEITPSDATRLSNPPVMVEQVIPETFEPPPEEIAPELQEPLSPKKEEDSILQSDWVNSEKFAWLTAGAILARADDRGIHGSNKVWSIAELQLSEQDYSCLKAWGNSASFSSRDLSKQYRTVSYSLSGREALALTFIVYASEVGRRNAIEGEIWPAVTENLGTGLRDFLMLHQGLNNASPRPWLKIEIERVLRGYNLRHAFDNAGTQAYARSIYLQFGFTCNGMQRLPLWLYGQQVPVAVEELKGNGPNRSPSFVDFWESLKEFRWKSITTEEFRQRLQENPWLPPVGINAVVTAVTTKPHLGEIQELTEVNASASLLGIPRLDIIGGQPVFHISLGDIWPESLQEPAYTLVFDALNRVSIHRQSDGSYAFTNGVVTVSPVKSTLDVTLLASGQQVLDEPLRYQLWNEEEEFSFFKANGWKTTEERVHADRTPLYLICASDIELSTPADSLYSLFSDAARLHYFKNGIPSGFTLCLEGEPIWRAPDPSDSKKKLGIPAITIQATCLPTPCMWGDKARFRLSGIPAGVKPRRVLIGELRLPIKKENGSTAESERFTIIPGTMSLPPKGTMIGICQGELRRYSVSVLGKFSGVAIETAAGWVLPDNRKILDKADLQSARLLTLPSDSSLNGWAYTEGERFLARPSRYGDRIGQELVGLGSPLFLRKGPYNSIENPIEISQAVVDGGVLGMALRIDQSWCIAVRHDLEFSDEFEIYAWYPEEPEPIQINKNLWRYDVDTRSLLVAQLPGSHDDPCSFSLSFSGTCVGRTWCGFSAFYDMAAIISETPDWNVTAAWLAWWHVPVLAREIRPAVAKRISSQTVETLAAWMGLAHGATASPSMSGVTLRMKDAIRTFFHDDLPEKAKCAEVLQSLGMLSGDWYEDEDGAWEHYENLLEISPVVLTRLAKAATATLYNSKPDRVEWLIQLLRRKIAGVSDLDPVSEITRAENVLLATASRVMAVDEQFIKRSILEEARKLLKAERQPVRNLEYCLDIQPLRDWLALRLLI